MTEFYVKRSDVDKMLKDLHELYTNKYVAATNVVMERAWYNKRAAIEAALVKIVSLEAIEVN